jgi:hypothetical protein
MARARRPVAVVVPGVVPHPRYGTTVVATGLGLSDSEIRASYWAYRDATLFPQSAIVADLRAQNFTTMGRRYYVDLLLTCRACKRPFLFYAREQQHWFETLQFTVDAQCVHCIECRRSNQDIARRKRRYEAAISAPALDDAAFTTLVDDVVQLWHVGYLHDVQRLRRVRNLARKRIPDAPATVAIDELVAELARHHHIGRTGGRSGFRRR